jgi:hypothetical protein
MTKKINLTKIQESPIKTNAIAAFFKIVNHFLYPASSLKLNNIVNPPKIRIINVINAKSQRA